jgi:hypothetical protein
MISRLLNFSVHREFFRTMLKKFVLDFKIYKHCSLFLIAQNVVAVWRLLCVRRIQKNEKPHEFSVSSIKLG